MNLMRVCGKIAGNKQGRLLLWRVGSLKFPSGKGEYEKNHELMI
jgi:hypothetical protein